MKKFFLFVFFAVCGVVLQSNVTVEAQTTACIPMPPCATTGVRDPQTGAIAYCDLAPGVNYCPITPPGQCVPRPLCSTTGIKDPATGAVAYCDLNPSINYCPPPQPTCTPLPPCATTGIKDPTTGAIAYCDVVQSVNWCPPPKPTCVPLPACASGIKDPVTGAIMICDLMPGVNWCPPQPPTCTPVPQCATTGIKDPATGAIAYCDLNPNINYCPVPPGTCTPLPACATSVTTTNTTGTTGSVALCDLNPKINWCPPPPPISCIPLPPCATSGITDPATGAIAYCDLNPAVKWCPKPPPPPVGGNQCGTVTSFGPGSATEDPAGAESCLWNHYQPVCQTATLTYTSRGVDAGQTHVVVLTPKTIATGVYPPRPPVTICAVSDTVTGYSAIPNMPPPAPQTYSCSGMIKDPAGNLVLANCGSEGNVTIPLAKPCTPPPACLYSTPRCLLAVPPGGWCSQPPPTPVHGDYNGDGKTDILDLRQVIDGFPATYTIFDYGTVVNFYDYLGK